MHLLVAFHEFHTYLLCARYLNERVNNRAPRNAFLVVVTMFALHNWRTTICKWHNPIPAKTNKTTQLSHGWAIRFRMIRYGMVIMLNKCHCKLKQSMQNHCAHVDLTQIIHDHIMHVDCLVIYYFAGFPKALKGSLGILRIWTRSDLVGVPQGSPGFP